MPAEARRLQIIDTINRSGTSVISIADLAERFGVSEMTIRRDLDWLEGKSMLTRVHGGAIALPGDFEKPFDARLMEGGPQKKSIGWAAAQLVHDGNRIILDAGTTTRQIVRHLADRAGLTVISNNIPAVTELSHFPHIATVLLGGTLKHQELCTVGSTVTRELSVLSVDTCFLSAAGFSVQKGATDPDMREVEVKQAMLHAAREVVFVADSSKYGIAQLVRICEIREIDKIVTDDNLSPQAQAELEAVGIQILKPGNVKPTTDPA
jgi:DeoR/GlpR family transcriptional regulator of sugar metabolism